MVIDEFSPAAYIFQEGDFAIVIPEAVVAVIEVKTTMDTAQFDMGIKNIASAKQTMKLPASLTGILFAYNSIINPTNKNLHNWFTRKTPTEYKDKKVLGPNAIFFFKKACLLTTRDMTGKISNGCEFYHRAFLDESVKKEIQIGWQLSIILAMLINACEKSNMKFTRTFPEGIAQRLIQQEGGMMDTERFSFGEGMSELEA